MWCVKAKLPLLLLDRYDAYLDGKIRPQSEKVTTNIGTPWSGTHDGRLDVGHYYVNVENSNSANMQMDELFIWETELSCDDAIRLYNAMGTGV